MNKLQENMRRFKTKNLNEATEADVAIKMDDIKSNLKNKGFKESKTFPGVYKKKGRGKTQYKFIFNPRKQNIKFAVINPSRDDISKFGLVQDDYGTWRDEISIDLGHEYEFNEIQDIITNIQ